MSLQGYSLYNLDTVATRTLDCDGVKQVKQNEENVVVIPFSTSWNG